MCSGPGALHSILGWRHGVPVSAWPTASGAGRGDEEEKEAEEEEGEGVAPLLKSGDSHLAGGEKTERQG